MQRVGIVDLGSNTARLVVYAFDPGRWYRLLDEIREPVRLGEGVATTGAIQATAAARALAALRLYADYARATSLDRLEVLATSAVREASNRDDFLERARRIGLPVTLLSGEAEAQLGVLAVANGFVLEDAWVIDLGGGSAQLSRMAGRRYAEGTDHPLGAVRLTELYFRNDPPRAAELAALRAAIRESLTDLLDRVGEHGWPIVAIGGTIRNLARAIQREQGYPLEPLHGYFLKRPELSRLTETLLELPRQERARWPGIQADRADVILAGALVYQAVLEGTGRDGLLVSGQGLREGAFYRHFLPPPHLLPDVRAFGVANLARQYPQPMRHIARVRRIARQLFEGLAPLHGLGAAEARLLDEAAMLHDVGMALGYHDHHQHGEHLVRMAPMPGLTHREQALLALLVRYHRKGEPKPGEYRGVLDAGDGERLTVLAACLRLAEQLERSRAGRVRGVRVDLNGDRVRIRIEAAEEPWVELSEAAKQAGLFEKAFGRGLQIQAADQRRSEHVA